MNYLQRLHVLFVSTLSMIVVWVGILGWAEVARGQASYEVLHAFEQEAQYPTAGVLRDSVGNLYGTTVYGGASGAGTVYKLAPDGTLTILHSFNGSDGYCPFADVLQDSTGNLYGTTPYGGAVGGGVVFAIENHPPVANAGPNQTVTAGADCRASVVLDGTGSSDPDDDALTFTWSGPFGTASGPTQTVSLPVGTHTITLTVDDGKGGTTSDAVTVTVMDTTPPNIASVTASLNVLWPPDHRMVPEVVTVSASDTCSAAPVCKITSVSSNEPANGLGDGDMAPDWEIRGDLTLNLRAERSGKGSGRGYTITMRCADASGNSSTKTVAVTVPHDQPKK